MRFAVAPNAFIQGPRGFQESDPARAGFHREEYDSGFWKFLFHAGYEAGPVGEHFFRSFALREVVVPLVEHDQGRAVRRDDPVEQAEDIAGPRAAKSAVQHREVAKIPGQRGPQSNRGRPDEKDRMRRRGIPLIRLFKGPDFLLKGAGILALQRPASHQDGHR